MYANRLDNIFNTIFNNTLYHSPSCGRKQKQPEVNIYQDDAGYELRFKTPGLSKDDIDISVSENKLTFSSNSESENFNRAFELPKDADQNNITAEQKDGITRVTIPKIPAEMPRKIAVLGA